MKNKINLKKYLLISLLVSGLFLLIINLVTTYEYRIYNRQFNEKIVSIVAKVQEKYPMVSELEIMEILNNSSKPEQDIFFKYGIDIENDSIVLNNDEKLADFQKINMIIGLLGIGVIYVIFFGYERKKSRELNKITQYIQAINKNNYALDLRDNSEDELSILKNEIYKTTVMLKEVAFNKEQDKMNLKKSLEDISHQLKTPLTSILIMLDNLIDDNNMDQVTKEEFIKDIKREILNINFLVQSLLKLSKLDTNTVHYLKQKVKVEDLIKEAIKNVAALCDLKNIEIEFKAPKGINLNCDFLWQVEAITNILKNCVEHSLEESKVIIKCLETKAYVLITITDFGEGIAPEDLPHIFERFYKGKNASIDSVGIGLALAKNIIESENGNIVVESNQEQTTFEIRYYKI